MNSVNMPTVDTNRAMAIIVVGALVVLMLSKSALSGVVAS